MAVPVEPLPLSDYRASLAEYLRGIVFPATSVAARIIEERLPARYARDPLRPCLVIWACAAGNGEIADALPVAAAFDLFDRFLLLHDELSAEPAPLVARWGLGQSLNAGDALYALAFRTLASDVGDPKRRVLAARLVGEAVLRAIETDNDDIARNATLTGAAIEAGAIIAGASDAVSSGFARAGRLLATSPPAAVAELRSCGVSQNDLATFKEIARYVARRAA